MCFNKVSPKEIKQENYKVVYQYKRNQIRKNAMDAMEFYDELMEYQREVADFYTEQPDHILSSPENRFEEVFLTENIYNSQVKSVMFLYNELPEEFQTSRFGSADHKKFCKSIVVKPDREEITFMTWKKLDEWVEFTKHFNTDGRFKKSLIQLRMCLGAVHKSFSNGAGLDLIEGTSIPRVVNAINHFRPE